MKRNIALLCSILVFGGCASLGGRTAPVDFGSPYAQLGITPVKATPEEEAGVLLRMMTPADGILRSREETKLYAQVRDSSGKEILLNADRTETYKPGSCEGTFLLLSRSRIDGHEGAIVEETEVTSRGEIVKFIRGHHDSKEGKFDITSWTRTPLFPEKPVKIGDAWSYEESMAMKLDSRLVKQEDHIPYKLQARSKLTGFAEIKGVRCAVVETEAKQIQTQRFKVLWRGLTLYTQAKIRETAHIDYQKGVVMARVVRTEAYTNSADSQVNDLSLSQTLTWIV